MQSDQGLYCPFAESLDVVGYIDVQKRPFLCCVASQAEDPFLMVCHASARVFFFPRFNHCAEHAERSLFSYADNEGSVQTAKTL